MTHDRRIVSIVVISTTPFTGLETSMNIGGVITPIELYQPVTGMGGLWQNRKIANYMGIPITASQERKANYGVSDLQQFIPWSRWNTGPSISMLDYSSNSLLDMLAGNSVAAIAAPVIATPTATAGSLRISWSLNVNYSHAAPYSFFEANWVELLKVASGNTNATSISLGNMSADPSSGHLKAFVVKSYPAIINQSIQFNTLRFVKTTPEAIPTGAYIWPATITNSDGSTVTVNLTVNIV